MKKVTLILTLVLSSLLLYGNFSLTLKNHSTYTDNVFQLSEDDIDSHEDGHDKFSYIETRDDLINQTEASVFYRDNIGKFGYHFTVKGNYQAYLKNTDKSKYMLGAGLGFGYKNLDLDFFYGYYPDNYVRQYQDKDGTEEYEMFEYDKNLYKLDAQYRLSRKLYLLGYLKYDEYYHNEFFTEYDGKALTPGIGLKYSMSELYLIGWYYYRSFETDEDITEEDAVSDASYESNIYKGQLRFKKIKTSLFSYRPVLDFSYESRFYDGYDKFHSGREDYITSVSPSVKFYLRNLFNITLDYTYKSRNVTSETQSVEDDKTYTENQISLNFELPIKF